MMDQADVAKTSYGAEGHAGAESGARLAPVDHGLAVCASLTDSDLRPGMSLRQAARETPCLLSSSNTAAGAEPRDAAGRQAIKRYLPL